MSCDLSPCDERHLLWSDATQWDAISWVGDGMWLVAILRCVVQGGCVVWWIGRWAGEPYYQVLQVLHSNTTYFKVLLRTPRYYKVRLRTTQYRMTLQSTLKYYSILQSTTLSTCDKEALRSCKVLSSTQGAAQVPTEVRPKFHQGITKVPPRFSQDCSWVQICFAVPRFHQGSTKVPPTASSMNTSTFISTYLYI